MLKRLFLAAFILVLIGCITPEEGVTLSPTEMMEETPTTRPVPTETMGMDETPEVTMGEAPVESIEVAVEEMEIVVVANGNLPDGCTFIDSIMQERDGNQLMATITTLRDTDAICTQALVPFEEIIRFERVELDPGAYNVTVNDVSAAFTLVAPSVTTFEIALTDSMPGSVAQLTGNNFPADATVEIGIGSLNAEYDIIDSVETDADGAFSEDVILPNRLATGQTYVFVAVVDGQEILSEAFSVMGDDGAEIELVNIFLVALEDAGATGELIGCDDSLVLVEVLFDTPTAAPLTAAYEELLAIDEEFYGQSGLYNALYQSDLMLVSAEIIDGNAIIALEGTLTMGGTCDTPRVRAQLEQVALQFDTVKTVMVTINDESLDSLLDGNR